MSKANSLTDYPDPQLLAKDIRILLNSYKKCVGKDLLEPGSTESETICRLIDSSKIILSCDAQEVPLLRFANKSALTLWEWSWDTMRRTPAKNTAEPDERQVREHFLQEVRQKGYVSNYTGIRISSSGKRFRIKEATVWNLTDSQNEYIGQAATFDEWEYL